MKRILTMFLVGAMALSLAACGSKENSSDDTKSPKAPEGLSLGETAATDLAEFTLNRADLAVALENTSGDTYFHPKEYNAEEDSKNPFVAAKGHCLVAMTYTLKNLDRDILDLDGSFNGHLFSVSYGGEEYKSCETTYGMQKTEDSDWSSYQSINMLLMAGQTSSYRCYVDIPVEVANLEDDFTVSIYLPNSKGEQECFTYAVTAADRKAATEQEKSDAKDAHQEALKAEAAELAAVSPELAAQVSQQLDGEWEYSEGSIDYILNFNQGACRVDSTVNGAPALSNEGSYSVREKAILIQYNTGNAAKLYYTFENNVFYLQGPLAPVDSEVLGMI